MLSEVWKDIRGYEGFYQVSNYGRVRSITRTFKRKDGLVKTFQERVLKQGTNPNGYKYVNLSKGSGVYCARVHRLVAQAFLNNERNLPCINHKDEDKENNHVNNLEWCSYRYNNTYNNKHLSRATKVLQYSQDGEFIKAYISVSEAEKTVIGKRSNISACCSGKIKSCGGYVWKYA